MARALKNFKDIPVKEKIMLCLPAELAEQIDDTLFSLRKRLPRQEMYEEIARLIDELRAQQKLVTENAVRKLLKRKWNDKNFKKAYKEIRLKNSN